MAHSHTPGPWNLASITEGIDYEAEVRALGDPYVRVYTLATVYNHADATLIAAAPELLAALKMVLDAGEDNGDMEDVDWGQIRAAIAKAKGE